MPRVVPIRIRKYFVKDANNSDSSGIYETDSDDSPKTKHLPEKNKLHRKKDKIGPFHHSKKSQFRKLTKCKNKHCDNIAMSHDESSRTEF